MKPVGSARAMWFAVGAAGVWALVLVIGAFVVPVYGTATYVSFGPPTHFPPVPLTQTVADFLGLAGVVKMAVPLLVTAAVAGVLRRGLDPGSLSVAWTATALLALLMLSSLRTVGLFMLPAVAALVVACFMATRVAQADGT